METTASASILVIANFATRDTLRISLQEQGYVVLEADTQHKGLAELLIHPVDVTIYVMVEQDVNFIRHLRRATQMPIIIVSPHLDETLIAEALDTGADDYVVLPHQMIELLARVRVALRHRQRMPEAKLLRVGELTINSVNRSVHVGEQEAHLTLTEYRLLFVLALNVERVMTYDQLLIYTWGRASEKNRLTLRTNVSNLRKKLEQKGLRSHFITTKVNVGYVLENSLSALTLT